MVEEVFLTGRHVANPLAGLAQSRIAHSAEAPCTSWMFPLTFQDSSTFYSHRLS